MKKYIYFVSFVSHYPVGQTFSNTQISWDCKVDNFTEILKLEQYIAKSTIYKYDPKIINFFLMREIDVDEVQNYVTFDKDILDGILHYLNISITGFLLIPNIKHTIKSELMNKYHGKVNPNIISKLVDDKFKL